MIRSLTQPTHLILGGCGFIGSAVASHLLEKGAHVILADRAEPGKLPNGAAFMRFDMGNVDWDDLIGGVDVIHHYAWTSIPATADEDPASDLVQNAVPTLNLLNAIRRVRSKQPRIVFTSSGGTVYGRLLRVPVPEEHPIQPITAYGAGKAAVELYLGQYRALHGIDCRIARISNPYGAGQNIARGQGAASAFLRKALAGEPIEIWGDGEVTRDYIHVADVAAGLVALASAELGDGPHVFNIGSGRGVSLNGIVSEIEQRLGHPIVVNRMPSRPFDVPVSVLDVSRARDVLDWMPRLSFPDGLARTIEDLANP